MIERFSQRSRVKTSEETLAAEKEHSARLHEILRYKIVMGIDENNGRVRR